MKTITVSILLSVLSPLTTSADDLSKARWMHNTDGRTEVVIEISEKHKQENKGTFGGTSSDSKPSVVVVREEVCYSGGIGGVTCGVLLAQTREQCAEGQVTAAYRLHTYDADTNELVGTQFREGDCIAEPDPAASEVFEVTQADFQKLPLQGSGISLQPHDGQGIINLPVWVTTSPDAQILPATVLGRNITVKATPVSYTWDYGDGTIFTTTSPNKPYPHNDYEHTYTRISTPTITLTTTWAGAYSLDTTTWIPIPGTATTTDTTEPLNIEERKPVLVPAPTP
ncbi:hypothetical protein [Timonella sp. A28]|uniref:hypothetical protein n=1 Tax=Timonella sp. A28 TaxID=3442640 RepID=UPI003EC13211